MHLCSFCNGRTTQVHSHTTVSGLFTLGWMCPLKREQAMARTGE